MEEVVQNENKLHSKKEVDKVGNELDSVREQIYSSKLIATMQSMKVELESYKVDN